MTLPVYLERDHEVDILTTQSFEQSLISNAMNGNLDSFNQLVLKYQNLVYSYAFHLMGDSDRAEDVTQESFIKAFQKLGSFRSGSFRGWLFKIATTTSLDMHRQAKRHPTQPLYPVDDECEEVESPAWLADPAVSVERTVQKNEENESLYRILNELPPPIATSSR